MDCPEPINVTLWELSDKKIDNMRKYVAVKITKVRPDAFRNKPTLTGTLNSKIKVHESFLTY